MKIKNVFLTSGMIMAIATFPAISEDYYNSDIANSCQVDFLGGTGADNSAAPNSFQAQYTANQYTVDAGQYLAANGITGTQCPANSFCTGGTYTFNETTNQGIESCPTGFTLSAAGTSDENNCYHECTASDIENGTKVATVTGGTVTKGGTNTCAATCTTGYTFRAATAGTNPLSGKESIKGTGYAAKGNDGNEDFTDGNKTASDYNLTQNGSWGVSFSYGNIIGISSCNGTLGDPGYDWMYYNDSSDWSRSSEIFNQGNTGGYCWCKITGYTPTGGTLQSLSSAWVYSFDYGGSASGCAYDCASICTYNLKNNGVVRSAMFGVIDTSEPPACVANTINVTWNPANGNASTTNQCTYDGAITLPTAPEKTGYTFKGWKLVTGSRDGDM
ncbi:MAG: InlB B-repeat-containing protein [Alphaproteobacteria bacterium]